MSDSDSGSTDSDNNNLTPYYHYYLRGPRMPRLEEYYESPVDDDSSDSEPVLLDLGTTSDSDVSLHNTSEDLDYNSSDTSCSSSLLLPFINERHRKSDVSKSNHFSITKELYNREIGLYKNNAMWSNKFYQSVVAVQKLKLSKQLKGHEGCVNSLDFNSTGNLLASGSDDCKVCLWNWSEGKCILQHKSRHTRNIFQTKFLTTQGDIKIVSCGRDGLVVLSSVHDDSVYDKILAQHDLSCNKLAVHRDLPNVILSCGEDGFVKSIDIRESLIYGNERTTNLLHIKNGDTAMHLYGIDINPMKPSEFIINGNDEFIRMYDKRNLSAEPVKKFQRLPPTARDNDNVNNIPPRFHYRHITSAVYNYCGTEILASYSEDDIYLFETYGLPDTYLHRYDGHLNRITIKSVNFYGPRSEYVVSGSDCGNIFIWDKKTEAIVQRKHADANGTVNVLEAHPHIPTLATSGIDKTIKIWEPLKKWHQPNKYKLRMCLIKNRAERERRSRLYSGRYEEPDDSPGI